MLSHPVNDMEISLELKTVSLLLIKEGRLTAPLRKIWLEAQLGAAGTEEAKEQIEQRFPHAIPISRSTFQDVERCVKKGTLDMLDYFVPGTSLRGAWRSHLERMLRGGDDPERPRVCDPFGESACSKHLQPAEEAEAEGTNDEPEDKADIDSRPPYELSCPICKLFGNTTQGSRIAISDGERVVNGRVEGRDHVAINRHDGKAANGAKFKFFGLRDAKFSVSIRMRNFELWQVGLVASLLKDIEDGLVPLGSGKNKGYGKVTVQPTVVKLTYFGRTPGSELIGVGEHPEWGAWFRQRYGLASGDPVAIDAEWKQTTPWRSTATLDKDKTKDLLDTCRSIPFPRESFRELSERRHV